MRDGWLGDPECIALSGSVTATGNLRAREARMRGGFDAEAQKRGGRGRPAPPPGIPKVATSGEEPGLLSYNQKKPNATFAPPT